MKLEDVFTYTPQEAEELVHFLRTDAGKKLMSRVEGLQTIARDTLMYNLENGSEELSAHTVSHAQGQLRGYRDLYSLLNTAQVIYDNMLDKKGVEVDG